MVINTFDLYDILTDIIPGIIGTLLLIVLLVPEKDLNLVSGVIGGPGGALLIIATAYVTGRIIRNIKPWEYLFENSIVYIRNYDRAAAPFEKELESILTHQSELDHGLVETFKKIMAEQYNLDMLVVENAEENYTQDEYEIGLDTIKRVGYSDLYDKATLYQRYTIVSSFYESVSTLFLTIGFGFLISFIGTESFDIGYPHTVWTNSVENTPFLSFFAIIFLVIIGYITRRQYRKFDKKRGVAFISDIVKTHENEEY